MVVEKNRELEDLVSHHITLRKSDALARQPRFSIMFFLYIHRSVGFTELYKLLELTPGNLDHHLKKLKKMGYISIRKAISWRPLTIVEITKEGAVAFRIYVLTLKKLLKTIE